MVTFSILITFFFFFCFMMVLTPVKDSLSKLSQILKMLHVLFFFYHFEVFRYISYVHYVSHKWTINKLGHLLDGYNHSSLFGIIDTSIHFMFLITQTNHINVFRHTAEVPPGMRIMRWSKFGPRRTPYRHNVIAVRFRSVLAGFAGKSRMNFWFSKH